MKPLGTGKKQFDLQACKMCGKAYVEHAGSLSKGLCAGCRAEAARVLEKIRSYILRNPDHNLPLQDLAKAVGEPLLKLKVLYEIQSLQRESRIIPPSRAPLFKSEDQEQRKKKTLSNRYQRRDPKGR